MDLCSRCADLQILNLQTKSFVDMAHERFSPTVLLACIDDVRAKKCGSIFGVPKERGSFGSRNFAVVWYAPQSSVRVSIDVRPER